MGSNETIKQAVMAGMGIALLSQHTVLQELADGRLVGMKVPRLPIMRNWFLVHRAGHPLSPTERKLHDAILGLRGMLAT